LAASAMFMNKKLFAGYIQNLLPKSARLVTQSIFDGELFSAGIRMGNAMFFRVTYIELFCLWTRQRFAFSVMLSDSVSSRHCTSRCQITCLLLCFSTRTNAATSLFCRVIYAEHCRPIAIRLCL